MQEASHECQVLHDHSRACFQGCSPLRTPEQCEGDRSHRSKVQPQSTDEEIQRGPRRGYKLTCSSRFPGAPECRQTVGCNRPSLCGQKVTQLCGLLPDALVSSSLHVTSVTSRF